MTYWVISAKVAYDMDDQLRWVAYPATEETLEDVKKIASLFDRVAIVTQEIKEGDGK